MRNEGGRGNGWLTHGCYHSQGCMSSTVDRVACLQKSSAFPRPFLMFSLLVFLPVCAIGFVCPSYANYTIQSHQLISFTCEKYARLSFSGLDGSRAIDV